jgi:GT2 family glycosyltransferase
MVTYGAPDAVRRALAAVIENTEPCYEMIVIDNASPGRLGAKLARELDNARLVVNEENRGFGPANNQGASIAGGSLLVFLNSDAFVHPRWLSFLRARIEGDLSAGAIVPRLLNEDGTLQEAGALLFRNGYTQFAGFGDDPDRPAYLFARELAYGSAACLMVRRKAFFEIGGFDARYAPAYYEDVDLCLALAEKGYRTFYEPRAVVTHVRGASGSPDNALRLWYRNHPRFVERWRERLASLPEYTPPDGNARLQDAARDAPTPARLLLVTERFPEVEPGDPVALDVALRLAELYPRARRTLLVAQAPRTGNSMRRLCDFGWEIVSDQATIAKRLFHYDAVVFHGENARGIFGSVVDEAQPQAARLSSDVPDLPGALAAAGIPPRDLAEAPRPDLG